MITPSSCASCGILTGRQGSACPKCGGPLTPASAVAPAPKAPQLAPSVLARRTRRGPSIQALLIWLMVAGAAVVIAALLLMAQSKPTATELAQAMPSVAPPAPSSAPPKLVLISDGLVEAKAHARAWHEDAALVQVSATGAEGGVVNLSQGATLEHVFGVPTGVALPGNPVRSAVYVVRTTTQGLSGVEEQRPGALIAGEPTCTGQEAFSKAVAAGLDRARPAHVEYRHEARERRGLWTVSSTDESQLTRRVDGQSCAVVLR